MIFGNDPARAGDGSRAPAATATSAAADRQAVAERDRHPSSTARAAEGAGADILSLVNTFVGMVIDVERRRPALANVTGGLSGPAIRPLAVRLTRQVYEAVSIPIVGMGGIMDARDALEFILAGATAVQVGTANFVKPDASVRVVADLESWLADRGIASIRELVGALEVEPRKQT